MNEGIKTKKHHGRSIPLIVLYLLTSVILTTLLGVLLYLGFNYFRDDGLTYQLAEYAITGDGDSIRNYIVMYRGEADNHNDAINFLAWGTTHQRDFIEIVEGVESERKSHLCGRLGWAAHDSGQEAEFEAGFRNADSDCLRIIRASIEEYRQYKY